MDLNLGNQWQQVTCACCKRSYQCTPEDDYYGYPPDAPMPGSEDGYCFACLLTLNGRNPDTTQVLVIDETGAEWDPRDTAVRENFEGVTTTEGYMLVSVGDEAWVMAEGLPVPGPRLHVVGE